MRKCINILHTLILFSILLSCEPNSKPVKNIEKTKKTKEQITLKPKSMITVKVFEMNPFQENTIILYDETKECIIIDAGCYDDAERKELTSFIADNDLKPVKLLNTHCHLDHLFGNFFLKSTYDISYEAHKEDSVLLDHARSSASVYGFELKENPPPIDAFINENDIVKFGSSELKAIHVPGHSPGSLCFYSENQKFIIVGDVLFNGSIGRTDLPGGDYETLITGISNKLFTLGDDIIVYCGHGPSTTIGKERTTNPFFR